MIDHCDSCRRLSVAVMTCVTSSGVVCYRSAGGGSGLIGELCDYRSILGHSGHGNAVRANDSRSPTITAAPRS